MLVRRFIAFAFFLSSLATASSVHAQCDPTWDVTLGNPGISEGYLGPMASWNDGTGNKLYVGGSAKDIGGDPAIDYLGQYDPATGQWSRVGQGIGQGNTNAYITKILPWNDGTGEQLYVIGQFASAGGLTEANSFAKWDGTNWSGVGAGFTQQTVRTTWDMIPADIGDGERLYLAGSWSQIGGVNASGVAWFDGQQFGAWGTGDGVGVWGGFSPFVAGLKLWDDGSGPAIYACGRFQGIDNAQTRDVARFNANTGAWESFGQALLPTSVVNNMTSWAIFDDGNGEALYLGGQTFRISGDPNVYVVAKWDGNQWTGVGQTLSGRVTDIEVWDDGSGPALYITGTAVFEVNYFAKLVGNTWVPVLGSGVNNPPVSGNFSSAFGLLEWRNDLLVAGSFSQVGGLDPVTGVGQGTPIPARGLAAVKPCSTTVTADSLDIVLGTLIDGQLSDIDESDDNYLKILRGNPGSLFSPSIIADFEATLPNDDPNSLKVLLEASVNDTPNTQQIEMYNFDTSSFEIVDSSPSSQTDSQFLVELTGDLQRFVEAGTGLIRTRITYTASPTSISLGWNCCIDQLIWESN